MSMGMQPGKRQRKTGRIPPPPLTPTHPPTCKQTNTQTNTLTMSVRLDNNHAYKPQIREEKKWNNLLLRMRMYLRVFTQGALSLTTFYSNEVNFSAYTSLGGRKRFIMLCSTWCAGHTWMMYSLQSLTTSCLALILSSLPPRDGLELLTWSRQGMKTRWDRNREELLITKSSRVHHNDVIQHTHRYPRRQTQRWLMIEPPQSTICFI